MANMSKKAVYVPKYMIVACVTDPPNTIAITEISPINCEDSPKNGMPDRGQYDERNAIAIVHYKPPVDRETQMES